MLPATIAIVLFTLAPLASATAADVATPRVIVLADTGQEQDGLPVFRRHPDAGRYERVLSKGFSGRLIRLYAAAQRAAHPDREPRPAFLCLTDHQGGFPREGFVLDGETRRDVAYVDLHARSALTGRHGAIDQIFPHELMHIILRELAGPSPEGRSSQVHAIGVTTDRLTAFDEGLAEHAQVMSIEAPDAAPETRALATDGAGRARALAAMDAYRGALTTRWSVAPRAVMLFPFWFSGAEQVLRYHGVRANLFAHEPAIPPIASRRAYDVYLLENVLPGETSTPRKPLARLLATEGVISALFYRWVTDAALQHNPAGPAVHARLGLGISDVERGAVDPLDNAYLKLFAAFAERNRDVVSVVRAYDRLFPADREAVRRVMHSVLGVNEVPDVPEVWLLNDDMPNGRSLFDQFRAMPRAHAFDLNAAAVGDLIGVPGVDVARARAIVAAGPYRSARDLVRVRGLDHVVLARFERMAGAAERPQGSGNDESSLSVRDILMPYARYAAAVLAACAILAAFTYRLARRARWWRVALNGLAAALAGLLAGWLNESGSAWVAWMLPVVVFGGPATLWTAWKSGSWNAAARVLAAWSAAACIPALAVRQ